jgi:predicted  nucleic acid-binding Zn-ribbon protein
MRDKEYILQEIDYLNFRIKDTEDAISDYKKRIINLKRQRDNLRKELLENQQLLWRYGGEE